MENASSLMEQKRMWLNQEIVNLLKQHPHGVEKSHFWDIVNRNIKGIGSKVRYGVTNMNELFDFYENLEIVSENNISYVKLKSVNKTRMVNKPSFEDLKKVICEALDKHKGKIKREHFWDKVAERQGHVINPKDYGFNNLYEFLKQLSDVVIEVAEKNELYVKKKTSSDSNEPSAEKSSSYLGDNIYNFPSLNETIRSDPSKPSLVEVRQRFCDIVVNSPQGLSLHQLMEFYNRKYQKSPFNFQDYNVSNFEELFKLPEFRCFNVLIQNNTIMVYLKGHNSSQNMFPLVNQMQAPKWGEPAFPLRQQPVPNLQHVTDSFHLAPFSKLPPPKTNEKEIVIPPLNIAPGETLSKEQLDKIAKECIEILADNKEYVSAQAIENLFLKRLRKRNIREVGIRNLDYLPSVHEHNRMACKVNAYIQAFVTVRSVCTLKELEECVTLYVNESNSFQSLKLGPFHKMQIIFDLFKFPPGEESYPDLTTMDILDNIRNFLNENNWYKKHEMPEVMSYLTKAFYYNDPFQLGIRLRSLPLAIGVIKRAQKDDSALTKKVFDDMKFKLIEEIQSAFNKFRGYILATKQNETYLKEHYAKMSADAALKEIFERLCLLLEIYEPRTIFEQKQKRKFIEISNNFFQQISSHDLAKTVFHVAICVSSTELQATALEFLERSPQSPVNETNKNEVPPPPKEQVLQSLKKYLEKYMSSGTLNLNHFNKIEEKLLEEFNMTTFSNMGYGRFLSFLQNNMSIKKILDEAGLTISGTSSDSDKSGIGVYKASLADVCNFIVQCKDSCTTQNNLIENALCHHYTVNNLKGIGLGTIQHIVDLASKKPHPAPHVFYEAALCSQERSMNITLAKVGILGHQSQETALATLHNCPLLEDISAWSHWPLVFEPQFGKLLDFVHKYGGEKYIELDGGRKSVRTDFMVLETEPGKYLKVVSETSVDKFSSACSRIDMVNICGHLVSLIVHNKGLAMTPFAYLSNIILTLLFTLNNDTNNKQDNEKYIGNPAKFVLDCLVRLPIKICVSVANKMFLEPLGKVLGLTESKLVLWQNRQNIQETNRLETLGCFLGIAEWTGDLNKMKGSFVTSEIETIAEMEDDQQSDKEFEDEHIESDTEDSIYFSEDETVAITNIVPETETVEVLDDDQPEAISDKNSDVIVIDEENEESDTEDANNTQCEILPEEKKEEEICPQRALIETIRREEFGLGIKLNADGQKLIDRQQERLGRSLDRLSKDLYSKDSHFVLELIQNADDNTYPEKFSSKDSTDSPSVKFCINSSSVTILNNEVGFKEKNIRAICDVGKSTKEKRKFGYIGQKGIGFKSVFRITDCPEIHSNKYHIYFDVNSGPTGYILPHWSDNCFDPEDSWVTKIILPLKDGVQQSKSLAASFNDIHPSLLLFLHRLKKITLRNEVQDIETVMQRYDEPYDIVEITYNGNVDTWFVVKKLLDATKVSAQVKSDIDVESTEIALAFPMKLNKSFNSQVLPEKQPVFAFLPLRSYGLRFIIQGDFDLPSNREAVDSDSLWNQWLNSEIPSLFLEALEKFKTHPNFSSPVMAIASYLQFVPEEDEVLDFFKPIATHILKKLRSKPCIPCQSLTEGGSIQWKIPSQTLLGQDSLTMKVAPPQKLQEILNLYYLHADLASVLNTSITNSLGIEKIKTAHLLKIGEGLANGFSNTTVDSEQITKIAQWLACVYRSLDEMGNNEDIFAKLSEIRIIPLSSSVLTTLNTATVFLPMDSKKNPLQKQNDKFLPLWNDLRTLHAGLFSTDDPEINIQVHKLILQIGVQPLLSDNIINHHILPILQSDDWKLKNEAVLVNYVMFMKYQNDKNPNSFVFSGLSSIVYLKTNKGLLCPDEAAIHFTPSYGNKINLSKDLQGYDWILLSDVYLQGVSEISARLSWHEFFSKLKVTDFLSITESTVKVNKDNIDQLPWKPLYETWPACSGDYVIVDQTCQEFESLVKQNRNIDSFSKQMDVLCMKIDGLWKGGYDRYIMTTVKTSDGHILKEIPTSFAINLQTLPWFPAEEIKLENINGTVNVNKKFSEQVSNSLYMNSENLKHLLGHAASYTRNQLSNAAFCEFLNIKTSINPKDISNLLIKWGERTNDVEKMELCGSLKHMKSVYIYLSKHLTNDEVKNIFLYKPVIFVPNSSDGFRRDYVIGQMYKREEIWWNDSTGLIEKHKDSLKKYKKNCSLKSGVQNFYSDAEDFFFETVRIARFPLLQDYGELIQVLSYLEEDGLQSMMELYFLIGEKIHICNMSKKPELLEVMEQQKRKLVEILQSENIFPTKRNKLVSLQDIPVIADNKEYEKMFKDKLNFIDLEYETINKKKRKITDEKRKHIRYFYDLFKIGFLSNCIKEDIKTEMFKPCYELQNYMHQIIYPIQCYLYNSFPEIYDKWKQMRFHDTVVHWTFVKVQELEVWYTFIPNTEILVLQHETCLIYDNMFYVQENYLDFKNLNNHIARYFSSCDQFCFLSLKDFLVNIGEMLDNPTKFEIFLSTTSDLPSDEIPWEIQAPPPWALQPAPPPVAEISPVMNYPIAPEENPEQIPKGSTSGAIHSWPPASPAVTKENPDAKRSGNYGKTCSWPLPEAPGYYKPAQSTKFTISESADKQPSDSEKPVQETGKAVQQTGKAVQQTGKAVQQTGKPVSSTQDRNIVPHAPTDEEKGQRERSDQPSGQSSANIHTATNKDTSSTQGPRMEFFAGSEPPRSSSSSREHSQTNPEFVGQKTSLRRKRSNEDLEEPKAKRYPQPSFDFPIWLEGCKDLEYKELARGDELVIPEQYTLDPSSTDCNVMTARWGEHLVFNYLLQQKTKAESFIYSINWENELQETGQPYDIKVVLKQRDQNGGQSFHEEYIEVKSTRSEKKSIFEISNKEIEFANKKLASYHVYRVFNAGNSNNVQLLKIENLALHIKQKKIHLCLII